MFKVIKQKPTKQHTDDATKELLRRIDEKLDELSKWLKEQNTYHVCRDNQARTFPVKVDFYTKKPKK